MQTEPKDFTSVIKLLKTLILLDSVVLLPASS